MSVSEKGRAYDRDVVVKFDDAQIKEMLVRVDRDQGAPIVYANLSKFSRLGVDFVLDLVQIDPAEFHLTIEEARRSPEKPSQLEISGKVVGRIVMGAILVKNLRDQADQILEGVEVKQPEMKQSSKTEEAEAGTVGALPLASKQVQ